MSQSLPRGSASIDPAEAVYHALRSLDRAAADLSVAAHTVSGRRWVQVDKALRSVHSALVELRDVG